MVTTLGETFLWALREMVSARLGDARLNGRLARLLAAFISYPNGSQPDTFKSWGDLKAAHDGRLAQGQENRLWQAAADSDVQGVYGVTVQRADQRPERQAMLALQVVTVEVAAPAGKRALGSVTVTAILAREIGCPQNQAPLHWLLLTNLPVTTVEDVARCLQWWAWRLLALTYAAREHPEQPCTLWSGSRYGGAEVAAGSARAPYIRSEAAA